MKPSLQFSIPCLQVVEEQGPPSFNYIFYELPFPKFPFPPQSPEDPDSEKYRNWQFFVANGWCSGQGDFVQSMRIVLPDKKTVLVSTGDQPFSLKDMETPFMAVNLFQGVIFREPGTHWVQVLLDGNVVLEYPLVIRKAETTG